jgi:predicted RNA-binding protein with TRAM domain
MKIPDQLHCLFSTDIAEQNGSAVIEVPKRELELANLDHGVTYRVAIMPSASPDEGQPEPSPDPERGPPDPPVAAGETREVEIEDIGEQGDGITRVERGFVVIVPDTERGERVTVEITDVQQNVAFAEVVERQTHL